MAEKSAFKLLMVFEPQPEGGYTVACPILPELITGGDTIAEALANADDALVATIEAYEDLNRPLPRFFLAPSRTACAGKRESSHSARAARPAAPRR